MNGRNEKVRWGKPGTLRAEPMMTGSFLVLLISLTFWPSPAWSLCGFSSSPKTLKFWNFPGFTLRTFFSLNLYPVPGWSFLTWLQVQYYPYVDNSQFSPHLWTSISYQRLKDLPKRMSSSLIRPSTSIYNSYLRYNMLEQDTLFENKWIYNR